MSDNLKILLVGTGYMGKEYMKVLEAMSIETVVVGRGESSSLAFSEEFNKKVHSGGVEEFLIKNNNISDIAIVAVNIDQLFSVCKALLQNGVKKILLEKPGGMNKEEVSRLSELASLSGTKIFIAYNRRFYSSTNRLLDFVNDDGGVSSFNFEFTEWSSDIESLSHSVEIKEEWLIANSSHVIDTAFYIGGWPEKMTSFVSGSLSWHKKGAVYSGAGISRSGALFSYHANWNAPGRWGIEILTKKHRLYLRPMEKLAVQELNSLSINTIDLNDDVDMRFKPGLFEEVRSFIFNSDDNRLLSIDLQLEHMDVYKQIETGCCP